MKLHDITSSTNYIYLLQEREFLKTGELIYKVGRTTKPNYQRFNQYPNGSVLLFQMICMNCVKNETSIIEKFKEKFINRQDIGREYFEGDYNDMIDIIYSSIKTNDSVITNKHELPNIQKTTTENYVVADAEQTNEIEICNFIKENYNKALDIDSFAEEICRSLTRDEIKTTISLGFEDGMINLICDHIYKLDIARRPMHCIDQEKKILYIHDITNDIPWTKENNIQYIRSITSVITDMFHMMGHTWVHFNDNSALYPSIVSGIADCLPLYTLLKN